MRSWKIFDIIQERGWAHWPQWRRRRQRRKRQPRRRRQRRKRQLRRRRQRRKRQLRRKRQPRKSSNSPITLSPLGVGRPTPSVSLLFQSPFGLSCYIAIPKKLGWQLPAAMFNLEPQTGVRTHVSSLQGGRANPKTPLSERSLFYITYGNGSGIRSCGERPWHRKNMVSHDDAVISFFCQSQNANAEKLKTLFRKERWKDHFWCCPCPKSKDYEFRQSEWVLDPSLKCKNLDCIFQTLKEEGPPEI